MWFDTAIAAIGFILALFIGLRSRKETRHHTLRKISLRWVMQYSFQVMQDLTDK